MNRTVLIGAAALVMAAAAIGYLLGERSADSVEAEARSTADREVLYWVAPMDASYRRDQPGKSPMGMDLVPVYADGGGAADAPGFRIDPAVVANLGVRTVAAQSGRLDAPIRTLGRVTYNDERTAHIHLRADGWIERLRVRAQGEPVSAGDPLFEVYSPELINAQADYLRARRGGRQDLIEASRGRLAALGVAESQIDAVARAGSPRQYVTFFAPISGVVTELNAADGKFVTPTTDVMVISDLSSVWILSDVFEADARRLTPGAEVAAVTVFDPGATIRGRVDYIYPDLQPVTHTVRVRTEVDNRSAGLKPGMYVTSTIAGARREPATLIPTQALIRTGEQDRVIVALEEGRYRPAEVITGLEADGRIEILAGLDAGEQVVLSGQFLLDSESSFRGEALRLAGSIDADTHEPSVRQIDSARPTSTMGHDDMDHDGMDHDGMDQQDVDPAAENHDAMDHGAMNHD